MITKELYQGIEREIQPLIDTYGYIPTFEMDRIVKSINSQLAPMVTEGYTLSPSEQTLYDLLNADATLKDAFSEGAAMGFSAEIQSKFSELPPAFAESLKNLKMEELYQTKPIRAGLSEIAGTIVPTLTTRGLGRLTNKAQVITTGTQPKKSVLVRLTDYFRKSPVKQAGVFGATYGLGKTEGPLTDRFKKKQPYITAMLAMATQGVLGGATNLISQIADSVANAGSEAEGEEIARRIIMNALTSDKESIENAFEEAVEKMNLGKDITFADMGPNSRGAMDLVNLLPGRGRAIANKFLQERQEGRFGRLQTDLREAFGQGADYYESLQAIIDAKSQIGSERYNKAFYRDGNARIVPLDTTFESTIIDPTTGESEVLETSLQELFKRPALRDAVNRAGRLAANDGKESFVVLNDKGQLMFEGGELDGQFPDGIATEYLHYIKMALDDTIQTNNTGLKTADSMGRTELRQLMKLKNHLINVLETNEDYAIARKTFAGHAAIQDAMLAGRDILKPSAELPEITMASYSNSEKEAFRLGVQQAILDEMEKGTKGSDLAKKVFRSEYRDKLLRQTFPNTSQGEEAYNTFRNNFINEMETRQTEIEVLKGSQTAKRQAQKEIAEEMLKRRLSAKDLSVKGLVENAIGLDFPALEEQQMEAMAVKLAEILTETDYNKAVKLLRQGESLGNVLAKIDPLSIPKWIKAVTSFVGTPYAISDASAIVLDEVDKQIRGGIESAVDIDALKRAIFDDVNIENKQTSLDNIERSIPSTISKEILPEQKQSLAAQLDQALQSFQPSNIPLVPPVTAVTPESMLSETILPNPRDREILERRMRGSGIGSLA